MDVKKAIDKFESNRKHKEMLDIRKERYLENVKKTAVYPGLKNLKHTCFFNSVMQVQQNILNKANKTTTNTTNTNVNNINNNNTNNIKANNINQS